MVNYRLKGLMIEAVENQLRENNPKAVKETLSRLIKSGYSEQEAKEMIAAVLTEEMYYLLKNQEAYNEESYIKKLSMLPEYLLEKEDNVEDVMEDFKDMQDYEDEVYEDDINLPVIKEKVPGRNEPCSCGSGKKYKKCCGK